MIRDRYCNKDEWDQWVDETDAHIARMQELLQQPAGDPYYAPQFAAELAQENWEQMLRRYSRGDSVARLKVYFEPMLQAWELSERLGAQTWTAEDNFIRHTWAVNIDAYHADFWIISLALLLEVPDDQWQRLIALVGNAGEDTLLDRLIASRSPARKIGEHLCFPQPYAGLLKAIDAPKSRQAAQLKAFVKAWRSGLMAYRALARVEQLNPYKEPYWGFYDRPELLHSGGYFGLWCLEAAAAAKVFGLDDRRCLGLPHYPGDFLRPDGVSTHLPRLNVLPEQTSWMRWFRR